MSNLADLEILETTTFDYSQLDKDTSKELQVIAINISATTSNMKYLIGEQLNNAQELLSKNRYGCFIEWIESYGLKKQTAYNCINYYKTIAQNLDNKEKLKQLTDSKVYELAKLGPQQQKEILDNINLKDMSVKEVKELTRKLKEEQEYSNELQEAIKEKEKQINRLKTDIENIKKPEKEIVEKEVIKEVIPENLILEKQSLEEELEILRKRAEKAENTLSRIKLDKEISQDKVYSNAKLDNLLVNIKDFINNASKYTYLKDEFQKIPPQNKKILENKINEVENWTMLMKQALRNDENMLGNIIFGEGEIINE